MGTDYNPPGTGWTSVRGQVVQNEDGSISSPRNIITSISGARAIYQSYRIAHLKRIALYAQIIGLDAGNPPYDPIDLQKHGLAHIANFNDMSPRSKIKRGCLGYWNLLYSAERIAKFIVRGNFPEATRIADVLADKFHEVVMEWKPFTTVFNTLIKQLVLLGVSPVFWRDERDWRWMPIELQRFFVAQQASTNTDQLTCVCVESVFTAQYLYEAYLQYRGKRYSRPSGEPVPNDSLEINNESQEIKTPSMEEEESPWNSEELEKLLIFYANASVKPGSLIKDWVDLQQRIQEGDFVWESVFSDGFRIVSMFYQEYDGKISHYMFDRNFDNGTFLYFVDRQYNSFEEALVVFTMSPGEFTIHSNRGVGHEIFSAAQAIMQINCATVDMAKIASTPMLKTLSVGGKEFEQIRMFPGTPTNIGAAEFVQTNFGANIQQLIGASNFLNQLIDINVANSGDDPGTPDRDQGSLSPTEAKLKAFREFSIPKQNVQHFYSSFDTVIQNMVIKMLHSKLGYPGYEYARKWKERCIEEGVPKEIFELRGASPTEMPPHLAAKATRVAGDGSTLGTLMGLEAVQPFTGQFTPEGQKEYARMGIRATLGPEYVPTFISKDPEVGEDISLAAVENAIMKQGESPVVSPANDQQTHIVSHFALLNDIINAIKQQQMTPLDADKIFAVTIPHTGEHIEIFSKSIFAKDFIKQIEKSWKEIERFATNNRVEAGKLIESQLRQRQEDESKTQQVMSDAQRKDFVAQADAKRADFKVQSQVQRGADASKTRAEIMKDKTVRDADNQRLKVQLEASAKGGQGIPMSQQQQLKGQPTEELRSELNTLGGNRPASFDFEGTP